MECESDDWNSGSHLESWEWGLHFVDVEIELKGACIPDHIMELAYHPRTAHLWSFFMWEKINFYLKKKKTHNGGGRDKEFFFLIEL